MDATRLLETQHKEVKEELFEKYEATDDVAEKRELFVRIADDLSAHTTIEEKLFYPAVYVGELEDLLQEAVEEHLGAKRIIADLLELQPSDQSFDAKMKVLRELVEHHVEEEEGELFVKVRKNFAKDEIDTLGMELEAMFDELRETEPRNDVPNQTDEAAPLS